MKNDFRKKDFRIRTDEITGERKFFVRLNRKNRKLSEVDEKTYSIYYNSYKKMYRDIQHDVKVGLLSMDHTNDDGIALVDRVASTSDGLTEAERVMLGEMMQDLEESERKLLIDLIVMEISEEEMANRLNMTQSGVSKKKRRIIKRMRRKYHIEDSMDENHIKEKNQKTGRKV